MRHTRRARVDGELCFELLLLLLGQTIESHNAQNIVVALGTQPHRVQNRVQSLVPGHIHE